MHTAKSPKQKKNHIVFSYKENFKKKTYVFACILTLITSLLKSRELDQYFKKIQKIILFFLLILRITRLYVKRSLDIKKIVFFLLMLE